MASRRDVVSTCEVREAERVEDVTVRRCLLERDESFAHAIARLTELAEHMGERDPRPEMRWRKLQCGAVRVARGLELTDLVEALTKKEVRVGILGIVAQNIAQRLECFL